MFRREVKKQFNENKYNLLTRKGPMQTTQLAKFSYPKHMIGTIAMVVLAMNFTKRYYTLPHYHKDTSKPMFLSNGELHPMEKQPASASHLQKYTKHIM